MKILVIRFSSIGDCIWVTPILRCLKTQLACEVHFVTKKQYAPLFEANPNIDTLHLLGEKSLSELISLWRKEKFDYIIDLHNNLRTFYIKTALWNVPARSYRKLRWQKWLLVNFKINKMPANHVVDRYFETITPLGVQPDSKGLELHIPEQYHLGKDFFPPEFQEKFIAFVIGASYATKKMPTAKIIEFCKQMPMPVILIGGKEDETAGNEIENYFLANQNHLVWNLCGKLNLMQSAWVVSQAEIVYGHDTGLTHIAACFQKKVYMIFGSTTPELGLYPYQTPHHIIENKKLTCRPCSRLGKYACPQKHFKCMTELHFEI